MHHYRLHKIKTVNYLNNFELFVFLAMILYRADDVEKNQGPEMTTRVIHLLPHRYQFSTVTFLLYIIMFKVYSINYT